MLQPSCAIVYTVSSPLFYSPEFEAIKDRAVFLPNVKLHEAGHQDALYADGYSTLRMFIRKRMNSALIDSNAIDLAATMSGGVFRELARVMRIAIDRALADNREQILTQDVEKAAAEIRSGYWRILTSVQREFLLTVRRTNRMDEPDKLAQLLQMLAILEYSNGEPWCDVHPALHAMLDALEQNPDGS